MLLFDFLGFMCQAEMATLLPQFMQLDANPTWGGPTRFGSVASASNGRISTGLDREDSRLREDCRNLYLVLRNVQTKTVTSTLSCIVHTVLRTYIHMWMIQRLDLIDTGRRWPLHVDNAGATCR